MANRNGPRAAARFGRTYEERFALWKEYENVAMHFNDLNMRWRLQAMGGLATLVTVAGFVVGDIADLGTRYRGMLLLSGTLAFAWIGIAVIDLGYYSKLLHGAVDAIRAVEREAPHIKLSTRIDAKAECGAKWAPWVFYGSGLVPLLAIVCWAAVHYHRFTH